MKLCLDCNYLYSWNVKSYEAGEKVSKIEQNCQLLKNQSGQTSTSLSIQ